MNYSVYYVKIIGANGRILIRTYKPSSLKCRRTNKKGKKDDIIYMITLSKTTEISEGDLKVTEVKKFKVCD